MGGNYTVFESQVTSFCAGYVLFQVSCHSFDFKTPSHLMLQFEMTLDNGFYMPKGECTVQIHQPSQLT